jgi:hypothetical protein
MQVSKILAGKVSMCMQIHVHVCLSHMKMLLLVLRDPGGQGWHVHAAWLR